MLLFKSGHEIPGASAHARLCTGVKLAQASCLLQHHPAICPLAVEAGDSNTGTGPHCTALLGISGLTELIADPSSIGGNNMDQLYISVYEYDWVGITWISYDVSGYVDVTGWV